MEVMPLKAHIITSLIHLTQNIEHEIKLSVCQSTQGRRQMITSLVQGGLSIIKEALRTLHRPRPLRETYKNMISIYSAFNIHYGELLTLKPE